MKKETETHNKIWEAIDDIRTNHLFHIEKDMAEVKTDIGWLKEAHKASRQLAFGILATSLAGLLMGIVKLI